jgi:hypothetical protein
MNSAKPMSKIPNPSNLYRETYNELQRVMASNRFIFAQGAIGLAIAIVFVPIPLAVYLSAGSVLIILALAFERPYQLLRRLLPYGNWSPHLVALPVRVKVLSLIMVMVMIIMYVAILYVCFRFILPLTDDACMGSLVCLLLSHIL